MSRFILAVLAAISVQTNAQFANWPENQIDTQICAWQQPRAALIRDTIYIDGGILTWAPGLDNGETGELSSGFSRLGYVLSYNLSMPFGKDTNTTAILLENKFSEAGLGPDPGAITFNDGAMLANDAQFFLFAGEYYQNGDEDTASDDGDETLKYEIYNYNPGRDFQGPGFSDQSLGEDVTRNIAYGAAASAPSENKAWYFSGLTTRSRGPVFPVQNDSRATEVSDFLITVDMETQTFEEWTNTSITEDFNVRGRANAEMVWVPVGEQGILVVLGGATYPYWAGEDEMSDDPESSREESPAFMIDIDIYDVASGVWYQQSTTGGPETRTRGCAVVAHASDLSSFNIYYYGGMEGVDPEDPYYDDVWVLSMPSFTWIPVNEGTSLHARAGHKCFKPYDDQMMVIGGYPTLISLTCLEGGPVAIFNLTSAQWMESYDPAEYGDYGVPSLVQAEIGGDASGGATATAPAGGWATDALGEIFDADNGYDMSKITTWGPFTAAATPTQRPEIPEDDGGDGGLPTWVAPVLGVVLGLVLLTGCLVVFCLWRRRKAVKNGTSDAETEDTRGWIMAWIRGQGQQHAPDKAPTVTSSDETPSSPEMREARTLASTPSAMVASETSYEAPDNQVVEMEDTSRAAELHDTGMTPVEVNRKRSALKRAPRSHSNTSFSLGMDGDFNSAIAESPGARHGSGSNLAESPSQNVSPEPPFDRLTSGVSSVTERDASHLRNISETSMQHAELPASELTSTPAEAAPVPPTPDETTEHARSPMPISPPTGDESPGEDYLSAGSASSPARKSAFVEENMHQK